MRPALALLPSPLVGPAVWQPVAECLTSRGWTVATPQRTRAPRTPEDVLEAMLSGVPADHDVVLVPHSNAGLYVPRICAHRRVVGAVFVDAGLPPADGVVPLAPPALLQALAEKAGSDGLLPPWTQWWAEADVAGLFPGPDARARVEAEQARLPLSYFSASMPVPAAWDARLAGGYLAFGDTYADDRAGAEARGWPTRTMPGRHLHMLVDPVGVVIEMEALLAAAGVAPAGA